MPAVCPSVRPSTRGELGAEIGGGGRGLAGGDRGRRLGFGTRGKNLQLGRHSQRLGGHVVLCFPRRRSEGSQVSILASSFGEIRGGRGTTPPAIFVCLLACMDSRSRLTYLARS